MDATRYLISRFDEMAISATEIQEELEQLQNPTIKSDFGRNTTTGY